MPAQDPHGGTYIPSAYNTWNYGSTTFTTPAVSTTWNQLYDHINTGQHSHSINFPETKEPPMSTAQKIAIERREARERAMLEAAYAAWDECHLESTPDRGVFTFEVPCQRKDTRHLTYAALGLDVGQGGAKRWWITGRDGLNGGGTEDLLAWLVGHDVEPATAEFYDPEVSTDE